MTASLPQPWLADALELLDLRRNDRVLIFSAPTVAHVAAVRRSVGQGGRTVVIEPNRKVAEELASAVHTDIEVLGYEPDGDETLGDFDAMLACPLLTLSLEPKFWARLFVHNLRPGGRFVLDLPGEEMSDHFAKCWLDTGGTPEALEPLRGPSKAAMTEALTDAGLRNVSASAASHLMHLESPFALAALAKEVGDLDEQALAELGRRLVETLKTTGEVELVFHRTRVRGLH